MSSNSKIILIDTDVIIHFSKANQLDKIYKIFPYKIVILNKVLNEILNTSLQKKIKQLIKDDKIEKMDFPSDIKIIEEFAQLKSEGLGSGESACMSVARYNDNIIASSNFKDVRPYCERYNIDFYGTMDFLENAYIQKILSLNECENFVRDVVSKGSILPFNSFKKYLKFKK
jgi:predicted nucleic acid-binding protein